MKYLQDLRRSSPAGSYCRFLLCGPLLHGRLPIRWKQVWHLLCNQCLCHVHKWDNWVYRLNCDPESHNSAPDLHNNINGALFVQQSHWLFPYTILNMSVQHVATGMQESASVHEEWMGLLHQGKIWPELLCGVASSDIASAHENHLLVNLCWTSWEVHKQGWVVEYLSLQLCIAFSGYLISHTPVYFRWLSRSGYLTFAYSALYQNEFDGLRLDLTSTNPASSNATTGEKNSIWTLNTERCLLWKQIICMPASFDKYDSMSCLIYM